MSAAAASEPAWVPAPAATDGVRLPRELVPYLERLAENAHDNWARQRISEGWRWHSETRPDEKLNRLLVPYAELSEEDKKPDRLLAEQTLKLTIMLGFRIVPDDEPRG